MDTLTLSETERKLIDRFRQLDDDGREMVMGQALRELRRTATERKTGTKADAAHMVVCFNPIGR